MYQPAIIEDKIASIMKDDLTLTTYRVKYWHKERYQSICLKDITYIGYERKYNPKIVLTAIVIAVAVGGLLAVNDGKLDDGAFIAGIILIVGMISYAVFVEKTIEIASSGGKIKATVAGIKNSDALDMITRIEAAVFNYSGINTSVNQISAPNTTL